jgi:IS605 OrfB family transposase
MQLTLTASLITESSNALISQLDQMVNLHNKVKRKLYADIISYLKNNNIKSLPQSKSNQLKSSYQLKYPINARHYGSIFNDLNANISSTLEVNKENILNAKDNFLSLSKSIKVKEKTLDILNKKLDNKNYEINKFDGINRASLKKKIYYLKQKLQKANKKLTKLTDVEKTGNPHLCFGSKKLFRQQFQINSANNLSGLKSHSEWKKAWLESRNKSFMLIGSSDETSGNVNCQIKYIEGETYELKINVNPKASKLVNKYITVSIKVHNDKHCYLFNAVKNTENQQAITYRFYKDYENNTYKVFISFDKSKQKPKIVSSKLLGAIGVDINSDHLAVSEIDRFGNLNRSEIYKLDLKNKTKDQCFDNISCAIKKITDYSVKVNKPIIIEKLNFREKKKALKSGINIKYNLMLTSLAYSKIIELFKNRSFDKGLEIIEVNPAYTSKIGKFKYQELYKLTTHQAAAFVIARRGLLSYTKVSKKEKLVFITKKEKTISIRRIKYYPFDLPVRKNQKYDNNYWKEIEQNYLKAKKHKVQIKRNKRTFILGKQGLSSEVTVVADNIGVNRDSEFKLLFSPF